MPTFDYECPTCNDSITVLKMLDEVDIPEVCEKCGTTRLKQVQGANFKLKGTGFYSTDNMEID